MKRFHALDSLRAAMMLLGVWLHAVVGMSRDGGWPYKDAHPTAVYDWTLGLIHTFRMPVFFIMAGFFGALLWERGRGRFVANRLQRILAPFALFWALMYPGVLWAAAWSQSWAYPDSAARATGYVLSGQFLERLHPLHMWFLEYLLLLYATAFAVVSLAELACRNAAAASLFRSLNAWYRKALDSRWRAAIFAIPYAAALMLMRGAYLEDPPGFAPVGRIVAVYTLPFFFGWLLYRNRDLLDAFRRGAWVHVGAAAALITAWMIFVNPVQNRPEYFYWVKPLRAAAGSLLMWLVAFGVTGLFLKYFSAERSWGRYLSDGSYWMYLVHMPVLMFFQMSMAPLAWSAAVKVPIIAALTCPVLVLSYDLLARNTWVGALLNGRRYERRFFVRREVVAAQLERAV